MSAIQRRAVLFADLRGSTSLYELIGNADASEVVTETVDAIARRVPATGGVLVKTLGDGLMSVFPTATQAVDAADQMHEELDVVMARRASITGFGEARLQLQVCVALGETVEVSGDFFGDAVNVAARLLDHAGDNETLVTADVMRALPVESRSMFRSLDRVRLRGRVEPVEVHILSRRGLDTAPTLVGSPAMGLPGPESVVLIWGNIRRRFGAADMPVVIGRGAAADMQIDDARVSRSHCRIDLIGATLQLSDLSINGTFVRFASEDEIVSLRRGSCTLHGSGEVGLSGSPEDPGVAAMLFEVLHAPVRRQDDSGPGPLFR
ncbi:MAG TPA: adenylate/guanylate cyclase domain-containing protein [Burkholderiaceae bacterium]|nr:adenylate/guanylate cyclase domain-containing protein [Burkholderiaceae bacterium]